MTNTEKIRALYARLQAFGRHIEIEPELDFLGWAIKYDEDSETLFVSVGGTVIVQANTETDRYKIATVISVLRKHKMFLAVNLTCEQAVEYVLNISRIGTYAHDITRIKNPTPEEKALVESLLSGKQSLHL